MIFCTRKFTPIALGALFYPVRESIVECSIVSEMEHNMRCSILLGTEEYTLCMVHVITFSAQESGAAALLWRRHTMSVSSLT